MDLLKRILNLVKDRRFGILLKYLNKRLYFNNTAYGLKKSIMIDKKIPKSRIELEVKEMSDEHKKDILGRINNETSDDEYIELYRRQKMILNNVGKGYVGIELVSKKICYFSFIISSKDNNISKRYFNGLIPELKENEIIIEYGYIPPEFRGNRIMPFADKKVCEYARDNGAEYAICFVSLTNIPSLIGVLRSNFIPYIIRNNRWILFKQKVSFEGLSEYQRNYYKKLIK